MNEATPRLSLTRAAELCAQDFTITYRDGEGNEIGSETIWVRTATEPELRAMHEEIAVAEAAVRKRYADGTPLYESLKASLAEADADLAIEHLLGFEVATMWRKAARSAPQLMPLNETAYDGKPAALAKAQEEHQKRRDEWIAKQAEEVEKLFAQRREELGKLPIEQVIEDAARLTARAKIGEEIGALEEPYKIMYRVYRSDDHSKRYFTSIEQVPEPGSVREWLLAALDEVDFVEPVQIKNSHGRFVLPSGPAESSQEATPARSTKGSRGSGSRKKNSRGGQRQS